MIFLLFPAALAAGGNPEVGLPKVDRLIREKNYNEAILELANYMSENPEDFDGAQRRLRRIIELRVSYNDKAMDLLLVLAEEPTNDKKKLEMINYLETLEKNPNASTQNFIADTKAAALFTYNRARFDEIMKTGDAAIDAGKYTDAIRIFQEGFVLYKDEFDAENDPSIVSAVNARLGSIISQISSFQALQASWTAAVESYRSAVTARDAALVESAEVKLDAELARYAAVRNSFAESGWYFEDQFAVVQKQNNTETDNSFLPFAYRFALGRKTAARFEGILGACDAQWNAAMDVLDKTSLDAVRILWTASLSSFGSGNTAEALSTLDSARRIAAVSGTLSLSLSRFTVRPDTWGVRGYAEFARSLDNTRALVSLLGTTGARYGDYLKLVADMGAYAPAPAVADAARKSPSEAVSHWTGNIADLQKLSGDLAGAAASAAKLAEAGQYTAEFSSWRASFASSVSSDILASYDKIAAYQADSSTILASEWQASYTQALGLLDGVKDPSSSTILYYPAESISSFNALRTGVIADRKSLVSVIDTLSKVSEPVLADRKYAQSVADVRKAVAVLDGLYTDSGAAIARANAKVLQANLARQESDLRYTQARTALKQSDFQSARDNLQRARDKINTALSFQEDSALRKSSDDKLEALGADITRIENEAVVREVRTLISTGKSAYYLGNFDSAEQTFIQAKSRWAVTNIEANPEITNWITIVSTALSMKTGRTIPVSAPLYPQMSQILNTANQLFSEGKKLMAAGKRTDSVAALTEAKAKLQQLQLVYPLNQDAGLLTLRIDQLIDPMAFTVYFRQKVEYVRQNYKTERQTTYSDLLDLYQINPSYPGLKKLLDEVEIFLGVQIPPPDPKALARSTELTRSAQKIYDANTRSMFQVALDQLDEAIKLNPDNQVAISLKDRVQTSSGGQSVAVLSAGDEAKYQQAVQELQKGNKITASALVEQLMQNPKSKNSAKIQDLKKRIDSQL